ncbi:MAG: hypothetical protein ABSC06_23315 [Rhodopila sp.]
MGTPSGVDAGLRQTAYRAGVATGPLFNIDVIEASTERGVVRLREGEHVIRPGGSVAA